MEEKFLRREDILRVTKGLDLPGGTWWLTSGAALVLYGVKEQTRDIDLVCTKELADRLEAQGVPYRRSPLGNTRIFTYSDEVEVLEDWETEEVVELDGLSVASLPSIRKQKEALGREKDWADIRLIDDFLGKKKNTFAAAIDGPAGAGKSSVAKAAAKELGFLYVDTGAIYRTITLYLLENGIDPADAGSVLEDIHVSVEHTPEGQKMILNGEDVTSRIRTEAVSMATSSVAAIPAVRAYLLGIQRDLAKNHNVLMDGRDIGTVVLPDAQLKVFLTASPEERARRRTLQLEQSGEPADYKQILEEIKARDHQDSTRAAAPLKPAPDSILLDTSGLDFEQSVQALADLVRQRQ